jgi:RNA ligase
MNYPNIPLIADMINKRYITVRKHSKFDLYIYNYTQKASSDHVWNESTEICRGLVCDSKGNIVARPFVKFYNYEELNSLDIKVPDLPFEVYEKLDGSLGILYFGDDGIPYIATRGSFESAQALHATNILHTKYANVLDKLNKSKTYLFEIIYNDPDVRGNLVVNYGDIDDIFLLAVIHTDSGDEDDINDYKDMFNVVTKYDSVSDYLKFRDMQDDSNREGFVIKFANNFRMKLKFAEYFKAHCTLNHLNLKNILNAIMNCTIDEYRKTVQDNLSEESLIYFDSMVADLLSKYSNIKSICDKDYRNDFSSRADAATYFNSCKYPAVLFKMLDGKNPSNVIWNYVAKSL